jgi:GT2 family glycosyltransferase
MTRAGGGALDAIAASGCSPEPSGLLEPEPRRALTLWSGRRRGSRRARPVRGFAPRHASIHRGRNGTPVRAEPPRWSETVTLHRVTTVGAVVVNFNGGEMVLAALRHLRRQSRGLDRIVVVDNASADGSPEQISSQHPDVELLRLPANEGFAAANNVGIRALRGCDWIALVNPDAFAERDWLAQLLQAAEAHPSYSFFSSLLLIARSPEIVDGAGDAYHVGGFAWRRDHGLRLASQRYTVREVFGPCAAAALYRADALAAVGGFDERYFCYFEDVDLAFRLRLAGHRCALVPGSRMRHVGSALTGRESAFTLYHSHRNMVWTWLRDTPRPLLWRSLPHFIATTTLSVAWYGSRGQLRTILKAKRDGFAALPRIRGERVVLHAQSQVDWRDLAGVMAHGRAAYLTATGRARRLAALPLEPDGFSPTD